MTRGDHHSACALKAFQSIPTNLTSEQWYGVGVVVTVHLAAEQTYRMMSDWACLSPLVGSCLRRDTPEAAAILGKSLSASASTEELVLTASSVLLVFTASSVHHVNYTIAITQRRFTVWV